MMRGFLHCYYHDIYGIRPPLNENFRTRSSG